MSDQQRLSTPSLLLSDEEFVQRLIGVGYTREEAVAMLQQDLADAAEEDGYDGP